MPNLKHFSVKSCAEKTPAINAASSLILCYGFRLGGLVDLLTLFEISILTLVSTHQPIESLIAFTIVGNDMPINRPLVQQHIL